MSLNVAEMQYLAKLLNVDELHIIDENGIIAAASVSQYVGFDMGAHEQTRAFLALLDSDGEDAYLIQEPQPNAAEGRIMQYVGVARKGQKGVVRLAFNNASSCLLFSNVCITWSILVRKVVNCCDSRVCQ